MKLKNSLSITIIALFAVLALSACEQGPAENTGEKIDEVITDAGNAIEDACENVKEGVKAKDKDC